MSTRILDQLIASGPAKGNLNDSTYKNLSYFVSFLLFSDAMSRLSGQKSVCMSVKNLLSFIRTAYDLSQLIKDRPLKLLFTQLAFNSQQQLLFSSLD